MESELIIKERERIDKGFLDVQYGYVYKCTRCLNLYISPYVIEVCCGMKPKFIAEMGVEDYLVLRNKEAARNNINLVNRYSKKRGNKNNKDSFGKSAMTSALLKAGLIS